MSLKDIIKRAHEKVEEMGGNEQFIGKRDELAAECGATSKDEVFDWIIDLGDGLAKKGLVLVNGPGRPQDLYAKPQDD